MNASKTSLAAGIILLLGGFIALVFPLPASIAITLLVGITFLLGGVASLYAGVFNAGLPGRWWIVLTGLLELALGVWLVADPLAGLVSLTVAAGVLFLLSGLGRIALSLSFRGTSGFWAVLLSGVISAGLGLYVLVNLQAASPVLLGTLLAIELILVGAALLSLGLALRNLR